MELKVWVDGFQRLVCGIGSQTTCQEVIYALAHATGKTGRFVLMERWRVSERSLAPHDKPLELLSKWGEYAHDVQFVLRCLPEKIASPSADAAKSSRDDNAAKSPISFRRGLMGKADVKLGNEDSIGANMPFPRRIAQSKSMDCCVLKNIQESGENKPILDQFRNQSISRIENSLKPAENPPQTKNNYAFLAKSDQNSNYEHLSHNLAPRKVSEGAIFNDSQVEYAEIRRNPNKSLQKSIKVMETDDIDSRQIFSINSAKNGAANLIDHIGYNRRPVPPADFWGHVSFGVKNPTSPIVRPQLPPRAAQHRPPPPSYEDTMKQRRSNYARVAPPVAKPMAMVEAMKKGSVAEQAQQNSPSVSDSTKASSVIRKIVYNFNSATASTNATEWPETREELLRIVEGQAKFLDQQKQRMSRASSSMGVVSFNGTNSNYAVVPPNYGSLGRKTNINNNNDRSSSHQNQEFSLAQQNLQSIMQKLPQKDQEIAEKRQILAKLQNEFNETGASIDSSEQNSIDNLNLTKEIVKQEEILRYKKRQLHDLEQKWENETSLAECQLEKILVVKKPDLEKNQVDVIGAKLVDVNFCSPPNSIVNETTPGVWV